MTPYRQVVEDLHQYLDSLAQQGANHFTARGFAEFRLDEFEGGRRMSPRRREERVVAERIWLSPRLQRYKKLQRRGLYRYLIACHEMSKPDVPWEFKSVLPDADVAQRWMRGQASKWVVGFFDNAIRDAVGPAATQEQIAMIEQRSRPLIGEFVQVMDDVMTA